MSSTEKKLGPFMLTALVCGNMIGSGVFLLPSDLAHIGTISLFSWIFTAGGALCGDDSTSEPPFGLAAIRLHEAESSRLVTILLRTSCSGPRACARGLALVAATPQRVGQPSFEQIVGPRFVSRNACTIRPKASISGVNATV